MPLPPITGGCSCFSLTNNAFEGYPSKVRNIMDHHCTLGYYFSSYWARSWLHSDIIIISGTLMQRRCQSCVNQLHSNGKVVIGKYSCKLSQPNITFFNLPSWNNRRADISVGAWLAPPSKLQVFRSKLPGGDFIMSSMHPNRVTLTAKGFTVRPWLIDGY